MYKIMCGIAVLLAVVLSGCDGVVMLHPLQEDDAWVVEPGLEGRWEEAGKEDPDYVEFTLDKTAYVVEAKFEDEGVLMFEGGVTKLGDKTFFCCVLDDSVMDRIDECLDTELWKAYMIPVFDVVMLELKGDTLRAGLIEEDWLKKQMKENTLGVEGTAMADMLVLTAPSKDLRAFFTRLAGIEEAWEYTSPLHRVKKSKDNGTPAEAAAKDRSEP